MTDQIDTADFEALARRYWGMWGDAMRAAGSGGGIPSPMDGYREAMDTWMRGATGTRPDFDGVLGNFNSQGKAWLARMQQVAAQFAGREHSAKDIAAAWRTAVGGASNPFVEVFGGMGGGGMLPMAQWQGAAESWLQGMRHQAADMLGTPAFGFTREHQERVQAVARAQLDLQDAFARYNQLMAGVGQDAFARFEAKLAEREEPGRQLGSVRALFDLWVEAAEEAYATAALSAEYRHAYGALVNAQMHWRASQQAISEQIVAALGLPGRAEVDSAHRKIAELERQLRRLQRQGETSSDMRGPERPQPAGSASAKPAATKTAVTKRVVSKPAANKPAAKKATRTPVKKPSARAATNKTAKSAARSARTATPTPTRRKR